MPSPYYPFMSLMGRGHDTFLCRITCKKARIWTFFWLDRKQYGWFALFRLAKMPPSVSCCWFQSAFLLAKWAVNTHASSFWNFCRLPQGAIHSTKISGNFGPKLNGSVRSHRKSFEKTGPLFEVDQFSRSDRLGFWLNGSRPQFSWIWRMPK